MNAPSQVIEKGKAVQIWKLVDFLYKYGNYFVQMAACTGVTNSVYAVMSCVSPAFTYLQYTSRKPVHTLDLFRLDVMLNKILNAMQKY